VISLHHVLWSLALLEGLRRRRAESEATLPTLKPRADHSEEAV
jgi:hypothetical protein